MKRKKIKSKKKNSLSQEGETIFFFSFIFFFLFDPVEYFKITCMLQNLCIFIKLYHFHLYL